MSVESLYNRYHDGIDFVLYLFILIYACRAALARMYPDRHGKSLGTVVGIILAISLMLVQRSIGFSIRSFGPIAAGIIALLIAMTVYNLLRQAGMDHATGGSTALVVTYFTIRAVLPDFFLWADRNEWAGYLHGILFLSILVAIWKLIKSIFDFGGVSSLKQAVSSTPFGVTDFVDSYKKEDLGELEFIRSKLSNLSVHGKRECKNVIRVLEQVADIIKTHGNDPRLARPACKVLDNILAQEHILKSELAQLQNANQNLARLNLSGYGDLANKYNRLNSDQKAKLKELLAEEREKAGFTETIKGISQTAESRLKEADQCIRGACQRLMAGQPQEALSWINKAIELEASIDTLLEEVRKHEKTMIRSLRKHFARLEASK